MGGVLEKDRVEMGAFSHDMCFIPQDMFWTYGAVALGVVRSIARLTEVHVCEYVVKPSLGA